MLKHRVMAVLLSLLLAGATYGQEVDTKSVVEDFGIYSCKWISILAKDIMTARQKDEPMSQTLPFALDRIRNFADDLAQYFGADIGELDEDELRAANESVYQEFKPIVTQIVNGAYQVPAWSHEDLQRDAISDFENSAFASCYEEFDEVAPDLEKALEE